MADDMYGSTPPPIGGRPVKAGSIGNAMIGTAASSGMLIVITFLTGIVLARILGPEGRGQYGELQFWGQFMMIILGMSLFDAIVVRIRNRGDEPRTVMPLVVLLVLALLLVMLVLILTGVWLNLIDVSNMDFSTTMLLVGMIAGVTLFNRGFTSIERADLSFGRLNVERVLSPGLFMVGAVGLAALGHANVISLVVIFLVTKLPVLILRFYRYRNDFFGQVDWSFGKEVLRLGAKFYPASAALAFAGQADRLFVVSLWREEWVGYYFVAFTATTAGMSLASQAVNMTLLPHFSGIEGDEKRLLLQRIIRLSMLAAIIVGAPVFLLAPWLIPFVYGADFAAAAFFVQGMTAAAILRPMIAVVNVANRASEQGRPGVEMALAALAVYAAGYLLTQYTTPTSLFIAMALANLASVAAGMRHLAMEGSLRIGLNLIPRPSDAVFLGKTGWRLTGGRALKILKRKAR